MTATVMELEDKVRKKSQELSLLQEGELAMQGQLRVRSDPSPVVAYASGTAKTACRYVSPRPTKDLSGNRRFRPRKRESASFSASTGICSHAGCLRDGERVRAEV